MDKFLKIQNCFITLQVKTSCYQTQAPAVLKSNADKNAILAINTRVVCKFSKSTTTSKHSPYIFSLTAEFTTIKSPKIIFACEFVNFQDSHIRGFYSIWKKYLNICN